MMRCSLLKFSIFILLCGISSVNVSCQSYIEGRRVDVSIELENDFENGMTEPWVEESQADARWKIEDKTSSWEPTNPSPQPTNGKNYLRVHRGASSSFGVAVLRSPTFTLLPNESYYFSFSFWIRSKWPQFTNLELYLAENGNEKLLLSLYNYSDITNLVWRTQSVSMTNDVLSSTLSFAFYAYCGGDHEDAVAIDDITFTSLQQSSSPDAMDLTAQVSNTDLSTTSETLSPTSPQMEQTSTSSTSTDVSSTTPTTTASTLEMELTTTTSSSAPTTTSTTNELTTFTSSTSDTSILTTTLTTITTLPPMLCDVTMTTPSNTFFSCPNNVEFKYPDPNNPCSKIYYQCSDCVATEKQCMKNQIFSNQTQSCRPCVLVPTCVDECSD